jgi:hypothetical protein
VDVPKASSSIGVADPSEKKSLIATRKRTKTHQLSRTASDRTDQMKQAASRMRAESVPYFLIVVNSVIAFAAAAALSPYPYWILLVGTGTLIFSLMALWAWYRITRTYIRFLARAGREKSKETHAA